MKRVWPQKREVENYDQDEKKDLKKVFMWETAIKRGRGFCGKKGQEFFEMLK